MVVACPACGTQQTIPAHGSKPAQRPEESVRAATRQPARNHVGPVARTRSSATTTNPPHRPARRARFEPAENKDGNRSLLLPAAIGGGILLAVGFVITVIVADRFRSTSQSDATVVVAQQTKPVAGTSNNSGPEVVPARANDAVAAPKGAPKPEPVATDTPLNGKGVYDRALRSCVFINNSGIGFGSGALVNAKDKLVVTNYHVVHRGASSGNERVVQKFDSSLDRSDRQDAKMRHFKAFDWRFESGKRYRIDMESNVIDSYLVIVDSRNQLVAFDDDSGGNLNARILLLPQMTDTCKIIASTFDGGLGRFTLTIREEIPGGGSVAKKLQNDSLEVYFPEFEGRLVLDRNRYLTMGKANPKLHRARLLAANESKDLALVQLDFIPPGAQSLVLSRDSASPGERVHSIGNPGGSGALWVYTSGTARTAPYRKQWQSAGFGGVMMHDAQVIETQSPTNPGDSGGPLLNDQAEMVGLTQGNLTTSNSISLFVDVDEVRSFLRANGYSGAERR
jgi:S1-C subfamily serine protease